MKQSDEETELNEKMTELDRKIHAHCDVLQRIASGFSTGSLERETLKVAVLAYSFAMLSHERKFTEFLSSAKKPLTKDELDYLQKLESDPDL